MKEIENVVSLFDGMSNGQIALSRLGIKYKNYYASDIDKYAMAVTQYNFPNTHQIGDVREIDISNLPKNVGLYFGGSPCQSFSFAGKRNGMSTTCEIEITTLEKYLELKAAKFEFEGHSYLLWEYVRVLRELQKVNSDIKFLLENVEMSKKWEEVISNELGCYPLKINSSLLSAQNRKRLYWTNIGPSHPDLLGRMISDIPQPEDKGLIIRDIIQEELEFSPSTPYLNNKHCNIQRKNMVKAITGKSNTINATMAKGQVSQFIKKESVVKLDSHYSSQGLVCVAGIDKNKRFVEDGKTLQRNFSQGERIYSDEGKSPTLSAVGGGTSGNSALIAVNKPNKICNVNPIGNGMNGNVYDINAKSPTSTSRSWEENNKLTDGFSYRKLTPIECERLQTVEDNYTALGMFTNASTTKKISKAQRYRMLGNGWTVDVIAHIFSYLDVV